MRYTDIDLQSTDIMWFGVDKNGNIAAFFSGGEFCVPEFVCKNIEETELLEEYFLTELVPSTQYALQVEDKDNSLIRDCKSLSEKGLYCFDISDKDGIDYEIISCPEKPIKVDSLPKNIYAIMQLHNMNVSFADARRIVIED